MRLSDKIYVSICMLFSALVIISNLTYQKFVSLALPFNFFYELSVGAILYPLTFLLSDLIAEFHGREKAKFCIKFTVLTNLCVAVILKLMDALPATTWSTMDNATFHHVFGFYSFTLISSMIACYIGQMIDVHLYLGLKKFTKNRFIVFRNIASSAISIFVDTSIVISLLALFHVLPENHAVSLIFNSYIWKVCFVILCSPVFYLIVSLLKSSSFPSRKLRRELLLQKVGK